MSVRAGTTSRRRLIGWIAIIAAVVSLLAVSVLDQGGIENDAERMQRLSESYACPVCQGQSVAESNAEVARTIRQQIRTEVQQDATDDEIRDTLISQYGGEVLLNPPAEGIGSLVWVLPVLVVVLGAAGVGAAVTGTSVLGREASDEDRRLVANARGSKPVALDSDEASTDETQDDSDSDSEVVDDEEE